MKQKEDAVKGLTGGVAYLFKANKVKWKCFVNYKKMNDLFLLRLLVFVVLVL